MVGIDPESPPEYEFQAEMEREERRRAKVIDPSDFGKITVPNDAQYALLKQSRALKAHPNKRLAVMEDEDGSFTAVWVELESDDLYNGWDNGAAKIARACGRTVRMDGDGYLYVLTPSRELVFLHRLIAAALLPRPKEGEVIVDHKNRKRADNRPDNLQWVTHAENCRNRGNNYVKTLREKGEWVPTRVSIGCVQVANTLRSSRWEHERASCAHAELMGDRDREEEEEEHVTHMVEWFTEQLRVAAQLTVSRDSGEGSPGAFVSITPTSHADVWLGQPALSEPAQWDEEEEEGEGEVMYGHTMGGPGALVI